MHKISAKYGAFWSVVDYLFKTVTQGLQYYPLEPSCSYVSFSRTSYYPCNDDNAMIVPYPRERGPMGGTHYIMLRGGGGGGGWGGVGGHSRNHCRSVLGMSTHARQANSTHVDTLQKRYSEYHYKKVVKCLPQISLLFVW